jgi:quercetin dioxygenase-like cupin family protein
MKNIISRTVLVLVLAISLIGWSFAHAQGKKKIQSQVSQTNHVMITPADIIWVDAPPSVPPGAKMAVLEGDPVKPGPFTMRIKLPAGYKIPPHWHPAIEHATVISGALNMGMGDKFDIAKTKELPAGSFSMMPAKAHHFAWAKEETIIQVHGIGPWGINYVNPTDDPRKKNREK